MHGCTELSSTLHPCAFAMAPHNITDPIGANANAPITRSASKYQIHGNRLSGVAFIIGILNQSSKSTSLAWVMPVLVTLLDDPVFLSPVPQRGELSRPRFVRCLKMRPMDCNNNAQICLNRWPPKLRLTTFLISTKFFP